MTAVKNKFKWCLRHREALLHEIGQLECDDGYATVTTIAEFMNTSKPTARKYLKRLVESGVIEETKEAYRSNVQMSKYVLGDTQYAAFLLGNMRDNYILYVQRVLGEIPIGENYG